MVVVGEGGTVVGGAVTAVVVGGTVRGAAVVGTGETGGAAGMVVGAARLEGPDAEVVAGVELAGGAAAAGARAVVDVWLAAGADRVLRPPVDPGFAGVLTGTAVVVDDGTVTACGREGLSIFDCSAFFSAVA